MPVNTKTILINDLRRELRWAYKDQSANNIGRLLREVTEYACDGDDAAADVAQAADIYIYFLQAVQRQDNADTTTRIWASAHRLMDALNKWEDAK